MVYCLPRRIHGGQAGLKMGNGGLAVILDSFREKFHIKAVKMMWGIPGSNKNVQFSKFNAQFSVLDVHLCELKIEH